MTQTYGGLKSFKLSKKPIITPLGIRVSMSCHFLFMVQRENHTSTLEISTISVPRHKEESLERKIMVFTRSITTLEFSTSIRINLRTSRSKVCDFIL